MQKTTPTEISNLLTELTPLSKEIQKRSAENSDIGFNVFQIVSDTYYRENFHSYVLYNLMSPKYHEEGKLFLHLFIDCLNDCETVHIDKKDFQNPIVERESDRVDVRIRDAISKKSIIIENKINDAADQYRQVPRYYEIEEEAGFDVVAVVYLTLIKGKQISTVDWTNSEKTTILPKMVYLPAHDTSGANLISNWLEKCVEVSTHEDVPAILRQYRNILKQLSSHAMDTELLEEFYEKTLDEEKFKTALQIRDLLPELCKHRADKIMNMFKNSTSVFNSKNVFPHERIWRAKFEDGNHPELRYIDIACLENRTEVIFVGFEGNTPEDFNKFLKEIGAGEDFRSFAPLVLVKDFKYPTEEKQLYEYLEQLFSKLEKANKVEVAE